MTAPPGRLWILDGHNILMAFEDLRHLQASGRGEEARRLLQDRLEEFAGRGGKRVLLVFDGGPRGAAGGSRRGEAGARASRFEVTYSRGHGGADRLILDEVRLRVERGEAVTVVTDDVATLAGALPRAVRHLGVREFWMAHIETPAEDDAKPVTGNFSDIERELLALEQADPPAVRRTSGAGRTGSHPAGESSPARPLSGEALREERLRRKRERGRLRQERRLKRRRH